MEWQHARVRGGDEGGGKGVKGIVRVREGVKLSVCHIVLSSRSSSDSKANLQTRQTRVEVAFPVFVSHFGCFPANAKERKVPFNIQYSVFNVPVQKSVVSSQ